MRVLTDPPGGHLRPDIYGNIPLYMERYGEDAGREIAEFELDHLQAIKKVLAEENIDCELNITRNMNVFTNEEDAKKVKKTYDALAARGLSFTEDLHYTPLKDAEGVSTCISKLENYRIQQFQ